MSKASWANLGEVMLLADSKESAEKLVTMATELRKPDLRRALLEMKTGKDMGQCVHEFNIIKLKQCVHCGEREHLYDEEDTN